MVLHNCHVVNSMLTSQKNIGTHHSKMIIVHYPNGRLFIYGDSCGTEIVLTVCSPAGLVCIRRTCVYHDCQFMRSRLLLPDSGIYSGGY